MYSVTPRSAQICAFYASAKTTTASADFLSVFPKWNLNTKPVDPASRRTCDPNVKDKSNPRLMD